MNESRMNEYRVDLHVDTLSKLAEHGGALTPQRPNFHVDAHKCQLSKMSLIGSAIFTVDGHPDPWGHCLKLLEERNLLHADKHQPFRIVTHPDQVDALPAGTTGLLTTIENGIVLEGRVERLHDLHEQGVRVLGLVWNGANNLAQGCLQDTGEGLTPFGVTVVKEAAKLGWAIDVSHLNPAGVLEVCQLEVPVLATHSNCKSIHNCPRNLDPEMLSALANIDAVVGLNIYPPFLGGDHDMSTFLNHVEELEQVLGKDSVCLGTDLDGIDDAMTGFRDYRDLDQLYDFLEASEEGRGLRVLGNNFMSFWRKWAMPNS